MVVAVKPTDEELRLLAARSWSTGHTQAMATELLELRAMTTWQPIETAPKGSGERGPSSVTHPDYIPSPHLLLATDDGPVVGYYDWYYHEGFGMGAGQGISAWRDAGDGRAVWATHWMPLPAPPLPDSDLSQASGGADPVTDLSPKGGW